MNHRVYVYDVAITSHVVTMVIECINWLVVPSSICENFLELLSFVYDIRIVKVSVGYFNTRYVIMTSLLLSVKKNSLETLEGFWTCCC